MGNWCALRIICKAAEVTDDPVLPMVFCHGDEGDTETGGVYLGIDPGSRKSHRVCDIEGAVTDTPGKTASPLNGV